MKKYLFSLGLLLSLALGGSAFATAVTSVHYGLPQPASVEKKLNVSATAGPAVGLGTQVTQKKLNVLKAVYDFSKLGGTSGTTYTLKDAAGGDAVLPAGAIIWDGVTDEVTNMTGTATMVLGVNSTNDLLTATATATWSGRQAIIPVGDAAHAVKVTTANSAVTATLGSGSITAGKINVFLFYVLSE